MGEYAIRKSDRTEVKIGTCEDMYYLRFEDRNKVSHLPNNVDPACDPDGLRFRLPFPDEDDQRPGEYREYNRGQRLYRMVPHHVYGEVSEEFTDPEKANDVGTIQLTHPKSGLLLNVTCHHGLQLPNVGPGVTAFWNGKGHSFELSSLRVALGKVWPVVRCIHCDQAWRYSWDQVFPYIPEPLRSRLAPYADDSFTIAA